MYPHIFLKQFKYFTASKLDIYHYSESFVLNNIPPINMKYNPMFVEFIFYTLFCLISLNYKYISCLIKKIIMWLDDTPNLFSILVFLLNILIVILILEWHFKQNSNFCQLVCNGTVDFDTRFLQLAIAESRFSTFLYTYFF